MKILVLLVGATEFLLGDESASPKSLMQIEDTPLTQLVIDGLRGLGSDVEFIFVVESAGSATDSLGTSLATLSRDECVVIELREPTQGALCTCLMASDHIDPDEELVIFEGGLVLDSDFTEIIQCFWDGSADAGAVTFDSIDPRWAYARIDDSGQIVEVAEKTAASRDAIAGFYYFKRGGDFVDSAMDTIAGEVKVNGQYLVASTLNELIIAGKRLIRFEIESKAHFQSAVASTSFRGSPESAVPAESPPVGRVNVVLPAAGAGSRFREAGYTKPKPFVDVLGEPMIQPVVANVSPVNGRTVLLLQQGHIEEERQTVDRLRSQGCQIVPVQGLTEGTACTVLLARPEFDSDDPLIVANSDQLVDFDVNDFVRDCIERDLDGSILVFQDPSRDTKWSFAKLDENDLVEEVAEKKPISDIATVGIYLFRHGSDFVRASAVMIARNDRVNGEFYTCPVYNYLVRMGKRIGVYEVEASQMHGLGTPQDLAKYLEGREN